MNIIFFGTPDFAVICLENILSSSHKVCCVVTAPDKQKGRGRNIAFSPVKNFAIEQNIPVLQPENLRDDEFVNSLKSFAADVFVVVAFRILPSKVFTIPSKGTFNLHGSLLPKYRGAAPIQWALINGETKTGVTTFFLKEKVDTGNIILQEEIEIKPEDNFETLHDRMAIIGSKVILKTLEMIEKDEIKLLPQNDELATKAPKIDSNICEIDWRKTNEEIHNLVRGLSPSPGAFFKVNGKLYKVFKTYILEQVELDNFLSHGQIQLIDKNEFVITKKNILVKTGTGFLEILEIQPEGRKRMTAEEFLRGYKF